VRSHRADVEEGTDPQPDPILHCHFGRRCRDVHCFWGKHTEDEVDEIVPH
jgi:hypothetical protein